jgi:hypothetical protein
MKKLTVAFVLFLISFQSFSQQTQTDASNNYNPPPKDYYQLKSDAKHAKVAAIILVSVGGGLAVGGLVAVAAGGLDNGVEDAYGDRSHDGDDLVRAGLIVGGIGAVSMLASIPFFITSHEYKKEARALKLHLNSSSYNIPVSGYRSISQSQLGIALSIPL